MCRRRAPPLPPPLTPLPTQVESNRGFRAVIECPNTHFVHFHFATSLFHLHLTVAADCEDFANTTFKVEHGWTEIAIATNLRKAGIVPTKAKRGVK